MAVTVNEKTGMQILRLTVSLDGIALRYANPIFSSTLVSVKKKHEH